MCRQTLVNFEGCVSEPTSAEALIFSGSKKPMVSSDEALEILSDPSYGQ